MNINEILLTKLQQRIIIKDLYKVGYKLSLLNRELENSRNTVLTVMLYHKQKSRNFGFNFTITGSLIFIYEQNVLSDSIENKIKQVVNGNPQLIDELKAIRQDIQRAWDHRKLQRKIPNKPVVAKKKNKL